jgi:hypothetical protein
MPASRDSDIPKGPTRLEGFAKFFKRYMNVSSIVAAALPIPVTALGAIPTYKFQTTILSTYTSLFCFLILGFIFYSRHQLAKAMFPEHFQKRRPSRVVNSMLLVQRSLVRLLPLILIIGSIFCAFQYQQLLVSSVGRKVVAFDLPPTEVPDEEILKRGLESQTPESRWLMIYYLGIFMMAEGAFILMAIQEYLQDLAMLGEMDVIRGPKVVRTVDSSSEGKELKSADSSEVLEAKLDLSRR